jgi:3-hydroxyisobutyrate dehydrogenase-like beta-hydroxyacid dehydrogenase
MPEAVGFIGLGIMGKGMAARLLSQGVAGTQEKPLVVWNRTPSKCTAFAQQFANKNIVVMGTAREVVEACGITYSMLSTPEASKAVFDMDDNGVLAGVSSGKSIVDCATLAESDMQRMNDAVVYKGG